MSRRGKLPVWEDLSKLADPPEADLADLLLIGMDRNEPEDRRHAALVRAYIIVVSGGEKRNRGRPKKRPGPNPDFYPMLLMWGEYRRTGETRGIPLARHAYAQRHDPKFAEHGVDLKGCEESVIRRWARRWKKVRK
jgi:hypothetical protein